jgi:hypothetical protein
MEAAVAQKDEITPHLLEILDRVADHPEEFLQQESAPHLYALFLLAQFREKQAYPLIVRAASLPPKTVDELLGDAITEGLPKILASVCGGDVSLIEQLAENKDADEFVRGSAINALLALVVNGDKSREEVLDYYAALLDGKLGKDDSDYVWSSVVSCATDLYPEEIYDKIKKAFDEDRVDEFVIGLDDVDRHLAAGKEAALAELHKNPHLQFVESAIEEMDWWYWYREPDLRPSHVKSLSDLTPAYQSEKQPQTPHKAPVKVGRNDPCPCGSGKKYKKCHGAQTAS